MCNFGRIVRIAVKDGCMGFSSAVAAPASNVYASGSETFFFLSTTENRKSKWACDCSSSSLYPKSYRGFVAWCLGKFLWQNLHSSHRLHIWLFCKGRYISACSMRQTCVLWKSRSVRRVSRILCQSARWVWSSLLWIVRCIQSSI